MWRRVVVHAFIDQPVEQVFDHLADPTSWPDFVPAVVLRHPIGSGPVGVGSTWEAVDRIGPFKIHFIDELAEIESGHRVVWLSSSPWNSRVEYVCDAEGSGTRIRASYEGDIAGWLRSIAWLPGPVVAWILAKDFKRLGALLAARATSGSDGAARP